MTFNPIWPWPAVIVVVIGLAITIVVVYWPRINHVSTTTRFSLIGLRMAALLVLAFAMLRPEIERDKDRSEKYVLLVVGDASRSMQTRDGPGNVSRREALVRAIAEAQPEFNELAERVEIRLFDFGESLRSVTELKSESKDELTRLDALIESLIGETEGGERFLGVVLLTDGAQRPQKTKPAEILEAARRLVLERKLPIYPVALGQSNTSANTRDVRIESIEVDPVAYQKNVVRVTAQVKADAVKGEDITLKLKVEDRSGTKDREPGEMKVPETTAETQPVRIIRLPKSRDTQRVVLSFLPKVAGSYKISVEAEPVDGELRTENNRMETIITVRAGGLRVAYFDRLRPEQKFLRGVADKKIQIDFFLMQPGPLPNRAFDEKIFADDRYNVILIGEVPAAAFDRISKKIRPAMAKRVRAGAGLAMTGGENSFFAGGYERRYLGGLLPVSENSTKSHAGDYRMIPTRLGLKRYVMQLTGGDAQNRAAWEKLEKLEGANILVPKNSDVEVWAETDKNIGNERLPLLLAHEVGQARVAAFAADSTWLWTLGGGEKHHLQFWQQLILWLAHQDSEPEKGPWVKVNPRNFTPGQTVPIEFGGKDDQSRPVVTAAGKKATFTIRIFGPKGLQKSFNVPGTRERNLFLLKPELLGDGKQPLKRLPAGDYWVEVTGVVGPANSTTTTSIGPPVRTRFIVNDRDLELDNPDAELQFLEDLARTTGGKRLMPEELGRFLQDRIAAVKSEQRSVLEPLWDHWLLLAIFVVLMTLEWGLRKTKGLV